MLVYVFDEILRFPSDRIFFKEFVICLFLLSCIKKCLETQHCAVSINQQLLNLMLPRLYGLDITLKAAALVLLYF